MSERKQYERVYGAKYEAGLDVKEIAKRVRADIKADIKADQLPEAKYSVRISRYSGGRSLDVQIGDFPEPILNTKRLALETAQPHVYFEAHRCPIYSEIATEVRGTVERIVRAYNHDGSDLMTDYFDVNFYSNVTFDWRQEQKERDEFRTAAEFSAKADAAAERHEATKAEDQSETVTAAEGWLL